MKVITEKYTTTFHCGSKKRYVHHIDYECPTCGNPMITEHDIDNGACPDCGEELEH